MMYFEFIDIMTEEEEKEWDSIIDTYNDMIDKMDEEIDRLQEWDTPPYNPQYEQLRSPEGEWEPDTVPPSEEYIAWEKNESEEWREACRKKSQLYVEMNGKLTELREKIAARNLAALNGDKVAIIERFKQLAKSLVDQVYACETKLQSQFEQETIVDDWRRSPYIVAINDHSWKLDPVTIKQQIERSLHIYYEALKDDAAALEEINGAADSYLSKCPYVAKVGEGVRNGRIYNCPRADTKYPPDKVDYPDNVTREVFDPRKNSEIYSEQGKYIHVGNERRGKNKGGRVNVWVQMTEALEEPATEENEQKPAKEIATAELQAKDPSEQTSMERRAARSKMVIDKLEKMGVIKGTGRLEPYDYTVFCAVCSLYRAGNHRLPFTAIYRMMTGNLNARPSVKAFRDIFRSLTKMMGTILMIDNTAESEAYGIERSAKTTHFIKGDIDYVLSNNNESICLTLDNFPILGQYAESTGRIRHIEYRQLTAPTAHQSAQSMTVQSYIFSRLNEITRNKGKSISFTDMYSKLGLDAPAGSNADNNLRRKRTDARKTAISVLDAQKSEGTIAGYELIKERNAITGAKIILPKGKHAKKSV